MMRWPRRLAAWLSLAGLLAVPPVLLTRWVPPAVVRLPDREQLAGWLAEPMSAQPLALLGWALGWLLWLMLAVAVIADIAGRVRRGARWARRIPLPTPLQAAAGGMVGVAVFGTGSTPPAQAAPAPVVPASPALDHDQAGARQLTPAAVHADGVSLPDGSWLPTPLAYAVADAAAVLWFGRRRSYLPGAGQPDPPPAAPAVRAVTAAVADDPDGRAGGGESGTQLIGPADLPARLSLAGPGAAAAARGLLLAALLPARAEGEAVVATVGDLRMLLGEIPERVAGLYAAPDLSAAVAAWRRHGEGISGRAGPVLILGAAHHHADISALTSPASGGTGPVLMLGPGTGRRWDVTVDGLVINPPGAGRLCVLTRSSARDLLTLAVSRTHSVPRTTAVGPDTHGGTVLDVAPPRRNAPLQVRLLGAWQVSADGAPVMIRRSAARQILAYLIVHPDGATSRQLIEAIWPHLPAHRITGRLYTAVSDLRQDLKPAGTDSVLLRAEDRYRLDPALVDSDLWQLRHRHSLAVTAIDPGSRHEHLHAVVDSYAGELAPGADWPWLGGAREHLRRDILDAYDALASASGDAAAALTFLQAAVEVDPLNENVHQRAVRLLEAQGQHDAAEALAAAFTDRLRRHGLRPAVDFRRLR